MEKTLLVSHAVSQFTGVKQDRVPDETTILHFRQLLNTRHIGDALFADLNRHLAAPEFHMKTGTLVDVSFITAPASSKNQAGARDPITQPFPLRWRQNGQMHRKMGFPLYDRLHDESRRRVQRRPRGMPSDA